MQIKVNLIGKKFSRLEVIGYSHDDAKGNAHWKCKCDCGNEISTRGTRLIRGEAKSCGCLCKEILVKLATKHGKWPTKLGKHGHPMYVIWHTMINRCANPSNHGFKNYGARGITVCDRWLDFDNFYADMGDRPSKSHSVGRIDNNMGYCPENCRWETFIEQANNRRGNRVETFNGVTDTITRLARANGLPPGRVISRISLGWSVDRALSEPINQSVSTGVKVSWQKRKSPAISNP